MMMGEYQHPLFDEKGKVVCQICGKSYLVISPKHLKVKHNIQYHDYTKRYPKAPLSSQEFVALGKYGKNKDIFIKEGEIGEEVQVEEIEVDIEELELEKLVKKEVHLNPMQAAKSRILDHLKIYFANIRKDYLIQQYGVDKNLKFEFITDFCDPVLKVVIQFPDTFWHNQEAFYDANKNIKLQQYGWKIIEIPSKSPQFDLIDQYVIEN